MTSELDLMVNETMMMNHFLHGKNPFQVYPELLSLFTENLTAESMPIMGVLFRLHRRKPGHYQLHLIPSEDLKNDLIELVMSLSGQDETNLQDIQQLMSLVKKLGLFIYPLQDKREAEILTYRMHGKMLTYEDEFLANPFLMEREGWWIHGGSDYLILRVGTLPESQKENKGWIYLGPISDKDWVYYHFSRLEKLFKLHFSIDLYELNEEQIIIKNHRSRPEFLEMVKFFIEARPFRFESLAIDIGEDEELREFFYETFLVRKFWIKLQTHLYLSSSPSSFSSSVSTQL